jgi:hypothetical protein
MQPLTQCLLGEDRRQPGVGVHGDSLRIRRRRRHQEDALRLKGMNLRHVRGGDRPGSIDLLGFRRLHDGIDAWQDAHAEPVELRPTAPVVIKQHILDRFPRAPLHNLVRAEPDRLAHGFGFIKVVRGRLDAVIDRGRLG